MTARRLYLSAHTPQNGTRKIPNTKMRAVKMPVKAATSGASSPIWWSRSGRKAKTWLTPVDSISAVMA